MPKSHRRPKAVAKKKLATTAKCLFNNLLTNVLPGHLKQNPLVFVENVTTPEEAVMLSPTLPLIYLWTRTTGDSKVQEMSINEFALDAFLNEHIDPASPVYGGIREQVRYYLWIHLLGDEDAAAHMQKEIADKKVGA